jgi:hypothetical protein
MPKLKSSDASAFLGGASIALGAIELQFDETKETFGEQARLVR